MNNNKKTSLDNSRNKERIAKDNSKDNLKDNKKENFKVEKLVELQIVERELLKKALEASKLKKNDELIKMQDILDEIDKPYKEVLEKINLMEHERKKIEGQISLNTEKIKKNEEKLFSGTITSAKELVNYQEEIKNLKEINDNLESKELEIMFEIDELKPKLTDLEQKRNNLINKIEKLNDEIKIRLTEVNKRISWLNNLKNKILSEIPKEIISNYTDIKQKKGGIALAIMQNNVCDMCNMELPIGELAKIKNAQKDNSNSIHKCPMCGRMLIVENEEISAIKEKIKNFLQE